MSKELLKGIIKNPFVRSALATGVAATGVVGVSKLAEVQAQNQPNIVPSTGIHGEAPITTSADAFNTLTRVDWNQEKAVNGEKISSFNYKIVDYQTDGVNVSAIEKFPNGDTYLSVGKTDTQTGKFYLEAKQKITTFTPTAIDMTSDKNTFVIGGLEKSSLKGIIYISKDGLKTLEKIDLTNNPDLDQVLDIKISSDNLVAFIRAADSTREELPSVWSFPLTGKNVDKLTVIQGGPNIASLDSKPLPGGTTLYTNYGSASPADTGYVRSTADTATKTLTMESFHHEQGYARGDVIYFRYNNQDIVWLLNMDTFSPDNPNGHTGTLFYNKDGIATAVQPNMNFYKDFPGDVLIQKATPEFIGKKGYLGILRYDYNSKNYLNIESFDLDNPNDLNKRQKLANPGLPAGGNVGDGFSFVKIQTDNGKQYLTVGIRNLQGSCDYEGVYGLEIQPDGSINPATAWERIESIVSVPSYKVYLPIAVRNN